MSVEQQEGTWKQLSLFEGESGNVCHGVGDRVAGAEADEERQALAALTED